MKAEISLDASAVDRMSCVYAHLTKHEIWLWALLGGQHKMRALINIVEQKVDEDDPAIKSFIALTGQCEALLWQIVAIQSRMRVKAAEIRDQQCDFEHKQPAGIEETKTDIDTALQIFKEEPLEDEEPHETEEATSDIDTALQIFKEEPLEEESVDPLSVDIPRKKPRKKSIRKPATCEICQAVFTTSGSLGAHRRIHTGERPFQCQFCDKNYRTSSQLGLHAMTHTGERPFPCGVCGRGFTKTSHLKLHMMQHTGERPIVCQVPSCGASFKTANALKRHSRIHTGERPFACEICGASFRQSGHRTDHMKRMHKIE